MTKIAPWLVAMSLLGVHQSVNSLGSEQISQELEAPLLSGDSLSLDYRTTESEFGTSLSMETTETTIYDSSTVANHRYPDMNLSEDNALKKREQNVDNHLDGANNHHANEFQPELEKHNRHHPFQIPEEDGFENEYPGPAMELAYAWKSIDFEFTDVESRNLAITNGEYIPENNLPLGLEVYRDTVFVTLPRWKKGIPATLATIPRNSTTKNPKLTPYPSWDWHDLRHCDTLTSVFRMQVDECNRLWVLDSGKINIAEKPHQLCPPAIFVFDLTTHTLLKKYVFRDDEVKDDSLFANIVVDVRYGECVSAIAYASDVLRYGIVVYDFFKDESFRVQNHLFYPDPLASRYDVHGITFHWTDGIFGIALSPVDINEDRTLFFHPMSSFREFAVPTSILRDKRSAEENPDKFIPIGKARAKDYGHSSGSTIDANGIMFFNMVTRDSVWCWDTRKEYVPQNLGVVGTSNVSLVFPNDIRVDHEEDPSVWVLSNKLPMYLFGYWNSKEVNFRIFKAKVRDAVRGTVCDPAYSVPETDPSFDTTC